MYGPVKCTHCRIIFRSVVHGSEADGIDGVNTGHSSYPIIKHYRCYGEMHHSFPGSLLAGYDSLSGVVLPTCTPTAVHGERLQIRLEFSLVLAIAVELSGAEALKTWLVLLPQLAYPLHRPSYVRQHRLHILRNSSCDHSRHREDHIQTCEATVMPDTLS